MQRLYSVRDCTEHSAKGSSRPRRDRAAAVGTPIAVQQRMMGHIRTSLNIYGDVVTNEMAEAHGKVVKLAIPTR